MPRGGVLRAVGHADVDSMDPARMYSDASWTLARGVVRTLFTYPLGFNAADGVEVVPDLAADDGDHNADYTEWTFTLREGVRWGPAIGGDPVAGVTGEEIVCTDVKYGLERLFRAPVRAAYDFYYASLEGTAEFRAGTAAEIEGIECDGDHEVRFTLSEPTVDWPLRLTLPASGPVARRAAERYDRGDRSEYDDHMVASGPYFVSEYRPGRRMVLERNPHWERGTDEVRAAYVDRVVWTVGVEDGDLATARIVRGRYDYGLDIVASGPMLQSVLRRPATRDRVLNEQDMCTRYLFMNATAEPFDDRRVRAAVNLAIDRDNLRRLFGGPVKGEIATSVLPPGLPGHAPSSDYNPFRTPSMAGDRRRARALLARAGYPNGYTRPVVVVGSSSSPHRALLDSVVADLTSIGFTNLKVRTLDFLDAYDVYADPRSTVGMGLSAGWCKDYPDAITFMRPLFLGATATEQGFNYARVDDDALDESIERAARTPLGPERAAAWRFANERATELAVWVPWLWDKTTVLHGPGLVGIAYNDFFRGVDWVGVAKESA